MADVKFDFSDSLVAISGAAGGFGIAMARRFAGAGARLILLDRTDAEFANEWPNAQADFFAYDQADRSSIERVTGLISVPDIFINNAGITIRKPLFEMTTAEILRIIDINLTGAILMATRIAARMAETGRGGTILNMASQLAFSGGENRGVYAVSKAGIVQFTKSAAAEWAKDGIRVCGLAPGAAATPMTADLQKDEAAMERIAARVPTGRMIPADEIAGMALFLASDAARSVRGETLVADDGYLVT